MKKRKCTQKTGLLCHSLREKRIMTGQADLLKLTASIVASLADSLAGGRHHYWKYIF
jgi:hypothetical protein